MFALFNSFGLFLKAGSLLTTPAVVWSVLS